MTRKLRLLESDSLRRLHPQPLKPLNEMWLSKLDSSCFRASLPVSMHVCFTYFTWEFYICIFSLLLLFVSLHPFPPSSTQVWCSATAAIMFAKKKKSRIQISAPSNFEHRVHTDFDEQEQKFVGLPRQWQSLIEDTAQRPKPFIDATIITTVEPRKVSENQRLSLSYWFFSDRRPKIFSWL